MAGPEDRPSGVRRIEFPEQQDVRLQAGAKRSVPPIDLALRSTEAALGQLTKVAMEEIRRGADVSPHVAAAERDLRSALKQLAFAKRTSR